MINHQPVIFEWSKNDRLMIDHQPVIFEWSKNDETITLNGIISISKISQES
ncbi:Hypothetical protein ADU73_1865 [Pediococcus damnosus]|nr:Hypothetical protein ADU73_1865 [Pediococcus damnosus]